VGAVINLLPGLEGMRMAILITLMIVLLIYLTASVYFGKEEKAELFIRA